MFKENRLIERGGDMVEHFYSFEENLDVPASVIGNKAFNLFRLWQSYPELNNSESFVVPTDSEIQVNYIAFETIDYPVIARSSSTVEDSTLSFAGIFESYICNNYNELMSAIKNIRNGVNSEQVFEYCKRFNIDFKSIRMAVLIQKYLTPQISGVTFTKNPLDNDTTKIYTEYCENSSDAVTSGSKKIQSLILNKNATDDKNDDLWGLREIALKAEIFLKCPADIEWIISDGDIYIVQIRPITT
jgi:pyruvate,water dikinase